MENLRGEHRLNIIIEYNKLVAICTANDWKRYLEKNLPGNKTQVEDVDLTIHYFRLHKEELNEDGTRCQTSTDASQIGE
jgi:hypothetical protein